MSDEPTGARGDRVAGRTQSQRDSAVSVRMIVVACGLGLGVIAAGVQIIILQTVEGQALSREAERNYVRAIPLDDWRGDIVDRDGRLMAVTVHRWSISADPSRIKAADAPITARVLGELLVDRLPAGVALECRRAPPGTLRATPRRSRCRG